jgi:hypothetical protein
VDARKLVLVQDNYRQEFAPGDDLQRCHPLVQTSAGGLESEEVPESPPGRESVLVQAPAPPLAAGLVIVLDPSQD